MWEGERLGEFAQELLYALAEREPIPWFRRAVKAYTQVADEIVEQMCALRYSATFTELPADTDKVGFKGYMYINETQTEIPVAKNWEVYNQLKEDGVQVLKPNVTNKAHLDFRDLDHAVSYKVFDRTDAESIHSMPTVSSRKDWTYWHKLKALFDEFPHDEMLPLVCPNRKSAARTDYISWYIHPRFVSESATHYFYGGHHLTLNSPNRHCGAITMTCSLRERRRQNLSREHRFYNSRQRSTRDGPCWREVRKLVSM